MTTPFDAPRNTDTAVIEPDDVATGNMADPVSDDRIPQDQWADMLAALAYWTTHPEMLPALWGFRPPT